MICLSQCLVIVLSSMSCSIVFFFFFFFLMIRRPPRSTLSSSSAASDVYKRQDQDTAGLMSLWEWFQPTLWAVEYICYTLQAAKTHREVKSTPIEWVNQAREYIYYHLHTDEDGPEDEYHQ
eukprot:TRINITY_DN8951_c0_g1_i6.p1 TRINITY_DN8951_c0_g1~~TRINITY_DN8951_c0_g1_i6.p1  ORF type:complete len:121 (-),score=39.63 TRINITY_DN8951_c0_g1_i6:189-551(-)